MAVTINAPDDWNDHTALLDYGFSCYQRALLVEKGSHLGTVPLAGGTAESVGVTAGEDFWFPMGAAETYTVDLELPAFVYAPVTAGARAGTASVRIEGRVMGTVPLYYEETVPQTVRRGLIEKLFGG